MLIYISLILFFTYLFFITIIYNNTYKYFIDLLADTNFFGQNLLTNECGAKQ